MDGPALSSAAQLTESIPPPGYALLAGVNLLAAADQTDTRAPITLPPHQLEQECWLGSVAVKLLLTLIGVPGSLRLVEDDGVLVGRMITCRAQTLLQEVVDVLYPGTDAAADISQRRPRRELAAGVLVERQGLTEDRDERGVAGKVDDVTLLPDPGREGVVDDP